MAAYRVQPSEVIQVSSEEELLRTTAMYVSEGFQVRTQRPTAVSLVKRKEFNLVYAVVGFFLCTIPLWIYLVYYATQSDRVVEIHLVSPPGSSPPRPDPTGTAALGGGPPSETGTVPPQLSPDGTHWWDGTQWHRLSS